MGNRKGLGWRRLGLRAQVLILTVAGLAVVFTLLGYLGVRTVEKSTDLVFQERLALARTMAGNADQSIGFSIDELERMGRLYLPSLLPGLSRREGLESCLSMCHEKAPLDISRAGMADARGRLIATEPPTAPGSEASLLLAVEEALRRQSSVVQESPDQERALLVVATPIRDEAGQPVGALVLEFNPLRRLPLSTGGLLGGSPYKIELVNREGTIFAQGGTRIGAVGQHWEELFSLISRGQAGIARHHSPQGDHMIVYAPLERVPWGVVVEQEPDVALQQLPVWRQRVLLLSLLFFVLAAITAWFVTGRVVRPVQALAGAARRIASGDLEHPLGVRGVGEVGLLAEAFEEMRFKLKISQEEVAAGQRELGVRVDQRTRELAQLLEASQALASAVGVGEISRVLLAQAQGLIPWADVGLVLLAGDKGGGLRVTASFGLAPDLPLSWGEGVNFVQAAFNTRQTILEEQVPPDCLRDYLLPEKAGLASPRVSAVAVPLLSQEQALGSLVLCNLRGQPIGEGQVRLMQALAHQAATAISNARLFQEASQATALRELDRTKTEFVARASHELRTPLASVKTLAESLLRPQLKLTPRQRRQFLEGINRGVDRLARITQDLLTVARMESGRLEFHTQAVSLAPLMERVVRDLASQEPRRPFSLHLPPSTPVWADPHRLEDVLVNLLTNATKYSPPESPIRVTLAQAGGEAVVSVTDQGIGIPEEEKGKLFQQFSRLGNAPATIQGVGLGLYISKALVEGMGGRIWAESRPGQGTTFHFTLPLARRDGPTARGEEAPVASDKS